MSRKSEKKKTVNPPEPETVGPDTAAAEPVPEADAAETAAHDKAGGAEVEALKKELAELKEKMLYLQADYQNYRKRTLKDIADARMLGVTSTLDPFLRVFDFLGMAQTAAAKSDNIEAIRQGVEMIIQEYIKAFEALGVKKQESIHQPFDPEWQEAVAQEPSETVPEGHVLREWTSAYRIGDRLLRPAKVVVSTGKPVPEAPAPETGKIDE